MPLFPTSNYSNRLLELYPEVVLDLMTRHVVKNQPSLQFEFLFKSANHNFKLAWLHDRFVICADE